MVASSTIEMSGEIVFDCCLPRAHLPLRLSPRNVPTMKPSTYLPRHRLRPTPTSDWVMSVAQAPCTRRYDWRPPPRHRATLLRLSSVARTARTQLCPSLGRAAREASLCCVLSVLVMYARRLAARRPQLPDRSGSIQKIESCLNSFAKPGRTLTLS